MGNGVDERDSIVEIYEPLSGLTSSLSSSAARDSGCWQPVPGVICKSRCVGVELMGDQLHTHNRPPTRNGPIKL